MPKIMVICLALITILVLSSCAKRNTAYQEEEWLTLERRVPIVGNPLDLKIDNNYMYVAQDQGGISLIRRTDYQHIWITKLNAADGSQAPLGRIKKISVVPEYNRMFINEVSATDRITIIDSSDPDTLLYIMEIVGGTGGIKDLDSFAIPNPPDIYTMGIGYCSAGGFKYDKYDGNVLNVNTFGVTPPATASGFDMTADYVLLTAEQRGLFIYNRATQQYISELALPGEAQKVKISGNIAFVASRQGGLNIVSFTNPSAPVLLSTYSTSSFATAVDVSGNKVAVNAGSSGIYLLDVSNPSSPKLLQRLTSCGYVNNVKFMGDKLVVAARDQGILVYKVR